MTQRIGGKAIPPATKTIFLPFHSSIGNELPKGPRNPIVCPSSKRSRPEVTRPAWRKVHSTYPLRVGADAIQKVHSPSPKAEYSAKLPAWNVKSLPSSSF